MLYLWTAEAGSFDKGKADLFATVDASDAYDEFDLENNMLMATLQKQSLSILSSDPQNNGTGVGVNSAITVTFESQIAEGDAYDSISLNDKDDKAVDITKTISGDKLELNMVPDYETKSSYSIRVGVADTGGLSFEKVFTISITDGNDAPTDITLTGGSVAENAASGTSEP
jgi:hypothetical protein